MIGYLKKEHHREAESLRGKAGQRFSNLPKSSSTNSRAVSNESFLNLKLRSL